MQQADINRAVARATGETVSAIKRLGFQLADFANPQNLDDDHAAPQFVDWDEVQAHRFQATGGRSWHELASV